MTFYILDHEFELAVKDGWLTGINREQVYLEKANRSAHIIYSGQSMTVNGTPGGFVTGLPGIDSFSVKSID